MSSGARVKMNVWEGAFAARGARVKMYVWEGAFAAALAIVGGRVALDEAWGLPALGPGRTLLLPAETGPQTLRSLGGTGATKLLHVTLG
jgi:hypothetical protein